MKKRSRFYIILSAIILLFGAKIAAYGATRNTDVTEAREGCIIVGINGTFLKADPDQIVKRINDIRMEACKEGIVNENTDEPLTEDDYVPVQWSNKLQQLAETRAAETMIYFEHDRPTGDAYNENNYISPVSECIAFAANGYYEDYDEPTEPVLSFDSAIDMWYSEKDSLGGHYMSMINMDYDYIGLGAFQSSEVPNDFSFGGWETLAGTCALDFASTSQARFFEEDYLEKLKDSSATNLEGSCLQLLEVDKNDILGFYINKEELTLFEGDTKPLRAIYHYLKDSDLYKNIAYLGNVKWSSNNEAVATVDQNGLLKAVSTGTAVITAKNEEGTTATCTVTVDADGSDSDWDFNEWLNNLTFTYKKNGITYKLYYKKGTATVTSVSKTKSSISIPATVSYDGDKYTVTTVKASACYNRKKLKYLTIGKNIKSIGKNAFKGCKKLKSITIKTKKLTTKNTGAASFKGIYAKATIKVPKTKYKAYKTLLKKKGVGKKARFKRI